jgi:pyruvate/2-oxoglutarate dehydrogenase complex dihydrolipoamide acyltransferase (E2) component
MATPIAVPQLGWEMTEGTLVEWLVEPGAVVAAGDPLYVLETDKTENEIPAPISGVVKSITGVVGETYACGTLIAEIE